MKKVVGAAFAAVFAILVGVRVLAPDATSMPPSQEPPPILAQVLDDAVKPDVTTGSPSRSESAPVDEESFYLPPKSGARVDAKVGPGAGVSTPQALLSLAPPPTANSSATPITAAAYIPLVQRASLSIGNVFGIESYTLQSYVLDLIKTSGAGWVRRNGLLWSSVEPNEGDRNWAAVSSIETDMINASQNKLKMIMIVRGTPYWAQKYPIPTPGPSCGPIAQAKFEAFARFMRDVVTRYSAPPYNVKYWELGNEPDVDYRVSLGNDPNQIYGCWGEPHDPNYGGAAYGQMLNAVYPAIKSANPNAQVLIGGLLLDCNPDLPPAICANPVPPRFFDGILSTGAGSFDGVSFHAYDYWKKNTLGQFTSPAWASAWDTTGPAFLAKSRYLKDLMANRGVVGKYLLLTENALQCYNCQTAPDDFQTTKSWYVVQAVVSTIAEGLRAMVHYDLDGQWRQTHLYMPGSVGPYNAFKTGARILSGVTSAVPLSITSGVRGYDFDSAAGRRWVVWSADGITRTVTLPAAPVAILDSQGVTVSTGTVLTITLEPNYVLFAP
ncbi:MAG: hypothetical protein ABIQ99_05460 [Thermoflexales bacterium]